MTMKMNLDFKIQTAPQIIGHKSITSPMNYNRYVIDSLSIQ